MHDPPAAALARSAWATGRQLPAVLQRAEVLDVAVVLLVAAPAVPRYVSMSYGTVDVLLAVAMTLPLLVRRSFPLTVFAIIFSATALALSAREDPLAIFGVLVALYTVAAYASRTRALVAAGLLELLVLVMVWRFADRSPFYIGVFITGTVLAALALGLYAGTRRAYLRALQERAERLERDRDQEVALAGAAERARIARELHDIVAHHLTVMVALSDGAAAAIPGAPDQAAEAVRAVSATGRRALSDTRGLLGVLRDDAGDATTREPVPGLADLDTLITRVRAAGLPVTYQLCGVPDGLPPGMQLTVYRLVQEALTNTLKHGGQGTNAVVRLRCDSQEVLVEVEDNGAGQATPVPAGVGRGLTGMQERAAAYGGGVSAGPRPSGGWTVSARLRFNEVTG